MRSRLSAGSAWRIRACLLLTVLLASGTARAQEPAAPESPPEIPESDSLVHITDVFDIWRAIRHKDPEPNVPWDYRRRMAAFAPVIGARPSSGLMLGVAGNVAFYRGEPSTTHISSVVASLTVSTKGQTAVTDRFTIFSSADRWRVDGDHRLQWTSLETHALGTSADTRAGVGADYDFFRLHHTVYYRLGRRLFAGAGLYFDNHVDVKPRDGAEPDWPTSPYVEYSEAHGLPLNSQGAAGTSLDVVWDTRDSFINPARGWLAKASYRTLFDGFLGGDSKLQRLNIDGRAYRRLSRDGRHTLATWAFAELVVGGVAPYFDLPATGQDTYGRSARGYSEGQFRGERLAYGEAEYRGTLTRNGLLGMVAFVNATTTTDLANDERLFDSVAIGGGAGLRLLINKRSKTNLCFDIGAGKQGSYGVYLSVQEAF